MGIKGKRKEAHVQSFRVLSYMDKQWQTKPLCYFRSNEVCANFPPWQCFFQGNPIVSPSFLSWGKKITKLRYSFSFTFSISHDQVALINRAEQELEAVMTGSQQCMGYFSLKRMQFKGYFKAKKKFVCTSLQYVHNYLYFIHLNILQVQKNNC